MTTLYPLVWLCHTNNRHCYYCLPRSLSVIRTVVSGGSTIIRLALIVVTEAGMSVSLVVKTSVGSKMKSLMTDILKHCLGCWLVKGPRVIETLL